MSTFKNLDEAKEFFMKERFATANGMQASFLNQPIPVPELRKRLQSLLGLTDWPQLIVRIGYPTDEPKITPRRKLEEMLITDKD